MPETNIHRGFANLGLPSQLTEQIERLGFTTPTPIQAMSIKPAAAGRDLIGIAQTGTGKTLAFGLPIVARLERGRIALILAPTRELAQQIREALLPFEKRCAVLIGGAPMGPQISQLRSRPSIVVATPGRLLDHMDRKTIDLARVSIVVLDEADRMLDMGFAPAIARILAATPKQHRQTMLFSATMPDEIADLAKQHLNNPLRIEIERPGTAASDIEQELVLVPHAEKPALLGGLLAEHRGSVLVFARTRHGARKLAKYVRTQGHTAAEIHSARTLAQRRQALDGFRRGAYRVLVATDIAARGIDVKDISLVINYDVPENAEDFTSTVLAGRAARAHRAAPSRLPQPSSVAISATSRNSCVGSSPHRLAHP